MVSDTSERRLATLLAKDEIRDVLYRYCRGVDRKDFEAVRRCYHPDALDHHGEDYVGGVDGAVAHFEANLRLFERTMHFLGNILIEVDGDRARSEAYAIAIHRLPAREGKALRDFVVGLRYVDDFEARQGEWRIARRVCAFEWSRIDPVPERSYRFGPGHVRGELHPGDVVYLASLAEAFA